ncbi:hypothetical protein EVAR_74407_1 [Eumeta japonica]|uniref:Uncharacterized protein n=1 Tax=Eumeta variegata TaxID=151549 RepID=A0A4C1SFF9_EUMVA|nr:hypothetical protein EVAR_74407_1 [Eumeta japonica]
MWVIEVGVTTIAYMVDPYWLLLLELLTRISVPTATVEVKNKILQESNVPSTTHMDTYQLSQDDEDDNDEGAEKRNPVHTPTTGLPRDFDRTPTTGLRLAAGP